MPGSGKDKNASFLKDKFPDISDIISTGDIFRGASTPDGKYGCYYPILKPHIENTNKGGLIPDDVIVMIVNMETAKRQKQHFSRFIFTGYPRTLGQFEEINKSPQNDVFVFLDCSQENAIIRTNNRYTKSLAKGENPRKDDLPEIFLNRLKNYQQYTLPLIMELKRRGNLITINANDTIENVAKDVIKKVLL